MQCYLISSLLTGLKGNKNLYPFSSLTLKIRVVQSSGPSFFKKSIYSLLDIPVSLLFFQLPYINIHSSIYQTTNNTGIDAYYKAN